LIFIAGGALCCLKCAMISTAVTPDEEITKIPNIYFVPYIRNMANSYTYQRKWFFLIFIAFASAFNYYLTYTIIKFDWFLIATYVIDTIEGWIAWWAFHNIVVFLDTKYPYSKLIIKRILIQLVSTTVAALLIIIILTELVSWLIKGRPAIINFYTNDIFIIVIWFLVLNGIYIALHFYNELQKSEQLRKEDKRITTQGFHVKQGKQELQISFNEILAFYSEGGFTYLLTRQDQKFIVDKSLDRIEESLSAESFFRLNRKYIINRIGVAGFKRAEDSKLNVQVIPFNNLPAEITVSRLRSIEFKKWFRLDEV
jgi:DNA-binding LytR/AlgR family response regulator